MYLNNLFTFSKHPYIFFNQDQTTLTFIGFNVNENLQCTDPKNPCDIIEDCTIPKSVYECLLTQGLNLKEESCNLWAKYVFVHVRMYVCMYVCMHVCVYMYVCMYVCMYVYMYVLM